MIEHWDVIRVNRPPPESNLQARLDLCRKLQDVGFSLVKATDDHWWLRQLSQFSDSTKLMAQWVADPDAYEAFVRESLETTRSRV